MWELLVLVCGFVLLLKAADLLVDGATGLSRRFGVPELVVGLTICAFGTSAPELLISVNAVLMDKPGLALGNVIGSNTANVLLVLGIPAMLSRLHTSQCDTRRDYAIMMAATVLFIGLAFVGVFTWVSGLILLAVLFVILGNTFMKAVRHRRDDDGSCAVATAEDDEEVEEHKMGTNGPRDGRNATNVLESVVVPGLGLNIARYNVGGQ